MHSVESPARATLSDGKVQDTDKSTFADSLAHTGSHISSPPMSTRQHRKVGGAKRASLTWPRDLRVISRHLPAEERSRP